MITLIALTVKITDLIYLLNYLPVFYKFYLSSTTPTIL